MIDSVKPYPTYKDSGVPWLGRVPEHWEVRKLKHIVSFSGGGTPSKSNTLFWEGHIPWVSPKDMRGALITDATDHVTEAAIAASATSLVSPGAVLIVVRSGILKRTIPVAINAVRVTLNQDMKALRPRVGLLSGYLRSLIQGNDAALIAEWTKQGATVESVEQELLANSRVSLLPLLEQFAIIRFLDYTDLRIRRYIRAKQRLIALLNEQKQAIIHHAVTRGLDPNVRLKPSGVEWLSDIPEHWSVKKLNQITNPKRPVMYGIVLPGPNVDVGVFIVKGGNCEPGRLRPERLSRTTYEIESAYVRSRLRHQDIVFAIRGGVGAAEMVPIELENANVTQDAARIAAGPGINSRWLLYALRAPVLQEHVRARIVGATVRGINIRDLKRVNVVVPTRDEQSAIVSFLDEVLADVDAAVNRAASEIGLLREYRIRLIADVVTGKLDVRLAAAGLPDEADKPELLADVDAVADGEPTEDPDLEATEKVEA